MENKLKIQISSLFRSCKSKKINSDVFQQPPPPPPVYFFANHLQHRQLIDIFSPKHPPSTDPESTDESFPTRRVSSTAAMRTKLCRRGRRRNPPHQQYQLPHELCDVETQILPPHHALHASTFTSTHNFGRENEKVKKSKRSKKVRSRSSRSFGMIDYEFPHSNYNGLFSSDDDDESDEEDDRTTFFSSKSLSSDSSGPLLRMRRTKHRSKKTANLKKKKDDKWRTSTCPVPQGRAVVKHSKDPYTDFMNSMIEMITQKQIFAADELEKLLHRFLSLNSDHHHRIIIHVFKDIRDALFNNF